MKIHTRPEGGRVAPPQPKADMADMIADIAAAHDSYQPEPVIEPTIPKLPTAPVPPLLVKKKPGGDHWLGSHVGLEGGEHVNNLLNFKSEIHQVAADAVDTAVHPVAHLTGTMMMTTAALGAASGALGVVLLKNGVQDVHHGISHRDWLHTIEGTSSLIVGTRSLAAGTVMAGHLFPEAMMAVQSAALAGKMLTPLGLVHGAIDTGLGLKDILAGFQQQNNVLLTKGALSVGVGTSLMAAAAGGGLPALASAGVFLAGRVWHDVANQDEGSPH